MGLSDEEDMSTGALYAVETLNTMKEEGYDFVGLINGDYSSPRYPGDRSRYVYLGTVGKLLLSLLQVERPM